MYPKGNNVHYMNLIVICVIKRLVIVVGVTVIASIVIKDVPT